jgi:hypothetical protein
MRSITDLWSGVDHGRMPGSGEDSFAKTSTPGSDRQDRTRFARFFGALLEAQGPLGAPARDAFRAIAELDDADLERLARWFAQHVNRWGQFPRDSSHGSPGSYTPGRRREAGRPTICVPCCINVTA